ncbi:MAG: hypothetical protein P1U56_00275 [Saprospiraceae bacterium]|nr:hypothetical protein [Saprospiraceae bacterium]
MKYIHTLLLALVFSFVLMGQQTTPERAERREKMENRIESQKVAYITQKLDLSPTEAQKFWPIYNEYQSKSKTLRVNYKENLNQADIESKDADQFLNDLFLQEQKELDLKREYFDKLKTSIPSKKVAKLYIIEKKFREEILEKIRNQIGKKKRKARRNRTN